MSTPASPLPNIAIISLGDMGSGIASLLSAHSYPLSTSVLNRSSHTRTRVQNLGLGIKAYETDNELLLNADIILSIVPPGEALATAKRVRAAFDATGGTTGRKDRGKRKLWYLDLNAVSPRRARDVAAALGVDQRLEGRYFSDGARTGSVSAPETGSQHETSINPEDDDDEEIIFLDGGIIGGPPKQQQSSNSDPSRTSTVTWTTPSIPTSGPHPLTSYPTHGTHLTTLLSIRHISPTIGSASGLKMCFASLSKGFAALALQSYTAAQAMGVLPELQRELGERVPAVKMRAENGITGCPPKAYRWVEEMREIGRCFGEEGGWDAGAGAGAGAGSSTGSSVGAGSNTGVGGKEGLDESGHDGGFANIFGRIAQVYAFMADETILGQERIGERKRGTMPEDVAEILADALMEKKK